MTDDPCPVCGKNRVLVGRVHNCAPPPLPSFVTKPPARAKPSSSRAVVVQDKVAELEDEVKALKKALAKRVDTTVVSTAVASTAECPVCKARREAKTAAQKKWRRTKGQLDVRLQPATER